jgi:hypothetical protein
MTTSRARHGSGTLARLGWARVLLLAAILAGIFVMHTAGHAEDASARSSAPPAAVAPRHADGHVQTDHGAHTLHAGDLAPTAGAPAVTADPTRSSDHLHFGCDLTSMCLGLLAGAAVLLVLTRTRTPVPARGPTAAALRGWAALATAPPRPPSLAVLSVSRT